MIFWECNSLVLERSEGLLLQCISKLMHSIENTWIPAYAIGSGGRAGTE